MLNEPSVFELLKFYCSRVTSPKTVSKAKSIDLSLTGQEQFDIGLHCLLKLCS